jgi:hypothetical protein
MSLIIENDGEEIKKTNYFESPYARGNKFYLSINGGAVRLLLPPSYIPEFQKEWKLAKRFVLTRKRMIEFGIPDGYEIWLDDKSNDPFKIQMSSNSADRLLPKEDHNRTIQFSVWGPGPKKILSGSILFQYQL